MGVGVGRRLDRLDATVRYVLCEFRVKGPGFRVKGPGFMVKGPGFRVKGPGFMVKGPGFRVKGPEVRVWSSECMGFMVWGLVFEI
jgi:hypothetical protein